MLRGVLYALLGALRMFYTSLGETSMFATVSPNPQGQPTESSGEGAPKAPAAKKGAPKAPAAKKGAEASARCLQPQHPTSARRGHSGSDILLRAKIFRFRNECLMIYEVQPLGVLVSNVFCLAFN